MSTGRNTQVTTWRRFTAAEKKAYRARVRRRLLRWEMGEWAVLPEQRHFFADGLGSRVPTVRVNGERL
jgi:hypothetical protein